MHVINLMKHDCKVQDSETGEVKTYRPSQMVAVASEGFEVRGDRILGALVVCRVRDRKVENLPDPQEGTVYLVAGLVLDALEGSGRSDVFAPDSGPSAVRNEQGHILHVTRLVGVR